MKNSIAVKKSSRYTVDSFTKSVFATTLGGIGFSEILLLQYFEKKLLANHVCDMESFDNTTKRYTSGLYIECDTGKIDVNSSNSLRYGLCIVFFNLLKLIKNSKRH